MEPKEHSKAIQRAVDAMNNAIQAARQDGVFCDLDVVPMYEAGFEVETVIVSTFERIEPDD